ncbi:uncharacterized protein LOC134747158 [Cydia strobilella]|uniref:uncharacterized protein LOC134747158 n=1 Tax=Cydia strobilella TaxID=1100964 RepID=UPI00300546FD
MRFHSQPVLRASLRGAPLPPPRRTPALIMRSRSTDVVALDPDRVRPTLAKQKPLTENSMSVDAPSPSSITPPEEESTDSSLVEEDGVSKPRRRRLHLPFGKKAKTPA